MHRDEGVKDKAQFKKNMLSVSKVALDALMYEHLLDCRSSAERNSADLRPEHGKESTQVAQSKPQFINSYCRLCLRPVRSKRSRRCEKTCIDCSKKRARGATCMYPRKRGKAGPLLYSHSAASATPHQPLKVVVLENRPSLGEDHGKANCD